MDTRYMLALALAVLLLLSGCGGAAPTTTDAPDAATPAAEAPPTTTDEETAPAPGGPPVATTTEPTAPTTSDEAAEPDPLPATETLTNPAGFAFTPPPGWFSPSNDLVPNVGGLAVVVPAGASPQDAPVTIFVNRGPNLFLVTTETETETDADALLDSLVVGTGSAEEAQLELLDRQDATVDGVSGRQGTIGGTDPNLGELGGQVIIVPTGEDDWFMLLGVGRASEWDADAYEALRASIDLIEPQIDFAALPDSTDVLSGTFFPLPPEGSIDSPIATGSNELPQLNYQTDLSLEETLAFYREAFTAEGATERTDEAIVEDTTFSIIFDGWSHAEGLAVVVQGVARDGTQTNVNIRLEDI